MAIAIRSVSSGTNGASYAATFTLAKPSGVVAGDVMYAFCVGDDTAVGGISGWQTVSNLTGSAALANFIIQRKVATSSEPASYTFTVNSVDSAFGIIALSGVDTTTPELVTPSMALITGATLTAPSVTPSATSSMLVTAYGIRGDGTATLSVTPPTGMTEQIDTGGDWAALSVDTQLLTSNAATGTKVATLSRNPNQGQHYAVSFVVREAGTVQSGPRWFLWNGNAEVPLNLSGSWNGSSVVPLTMSSTGAATSTVSITNIYKAPQQVDNYLTSNPELAPLAAQPQSKWINNQNDANGIPAMVTAANGKTLLLCVYAIPSRDSGGYSGGGFPDRASYLSFINSIKTNLGNAPAIISYEPDALGLSFGMTTANKAERIETLRQAVDILATIPNAETYIDASQWIAVTDQATALQAVDVHLIKGITLNTSGYDAQSSCYSYGNSVLAELATRGVTNKQYIIDSSRNGAGPLTEADRPLASPWLDTSQAWCNPPARLLGLAPGPVSGQPNCRATLWIKSPGESDGTFPTTAQSSYFGENAPSAGTFWIAAARSLLGLSPQKSTTGTVSDVKANFDSDWGSFSVRSPSATLVSGRGRVPVATTYDNIATTVSYTLKGGSIKARVYPPAANGATTEASVLMAINSATGGNRCIVWIDAVTNQIRFAGETGYWDAANVTIPYDPSAHAWVRIREAGGVTYWDTSPDGSTWTQRKSASSLSWVTTALDQSVQFVGYRGSGTANYFEVDNVNF